MYADNTKDPVETPVHPFDYGIGHEGVYAMTMLEQQRDAWLRKGWKVEPLYVAPQAVVEPPELSPDFTDTARAALLWVLWHHQGGNSPVGQPIRFALGMGQHDRLNEHQLAEAKRWERLHQVNPSVFPRGPELLTDGQIDAIWREKPRYHAAPIGVTDIEFARDIEAAAHGIGIKKGDRNGLKT